MTFAYTGGAFDHGASGSTASVTHGQTINAGDLVVGYVHSNDTGAISADAGGTAWTEAVDETPPSETARQAFYWKIAGGSEPSSYSWTVGGSTNWAVAVKVFTSATDAEVDAVAVTDRNPTGTNSIEVTAIDGEVISDNAVSIVAGGKDARGIAEAYTTADNSYTGVLGDRDEQATAIAHRIYTTGTTFSGPVDITPTDADDNITDRTHSVHMSFVESAAAGANTLLLKGIQEL